MNKIYCILIFFVLTGCEILKGKRRVSTDSIAVKKVDSTVTHKFEISDKRDSTWWREVINFLPKGHDTTINNTTVPVNNYYPAQIIREGGSFSREDMMRILDSANKNKVDTTSLIKSEETKSKETKALTQWWIWLIMGLMSVLIILLLFGRYFKITKK